jgi:hypothetical protein
MYPNVLKKASTTTVSSLSNLNTLVSNTDPLKATSTSSTADSAIDLEMKSSLTESKSMFSDLKEVLRAVEISKSQIDNSLNGMQRERENKILQIIDLIDEEE